MMGSSLLIKQKADYHRLAADIISNQLERLKSAGVEAPALSPDFTRSRFKTRLQVKVSVKLGDNGGQR